MGSWKCRGLTSHTLYAHQWGDYSCSLMANLAHVIQVSYQSEWIQEPSKESETPSSVGRHGIVTLHPLCSQTGTTRWWRVLRREGRKNGKPDLLREWGMWKGSRRRSFRGRARVEWRNRREAEIQACTGRGRIGNELLIAKALSRWLWFRR